MSFIQASASPQGTIGLDLGGSSIKGGVLSDQNERLWVRQAPSEVHNRPQEILERTAALAQDLQAQARAHGLSVTAVGISSTLDVDPRQGRFLSAHYPYLKIWDDFPIADWLQQRLGVPVVVENDGPAAAWGEFRLGAGAGHSSMLMVTLGSGVGGGAVLEGQRLSETVGSAACFGHMSINLHGPRCPCGLRGCWELYVSATALERRAATARNRFHGQTRLQARPTGRQIVQAAEEGDELATRLLAEHGRYLGIGLVNLANLFNPGLIVIGGGLSLAGAHLLASAEEILQAQRLPLRGEIKLSLAQFPYDAGWIGAALLAGDFIGGFHV